MSKYFGTDGIRGEASYFTKNDMAYNIGKALRLLRSKVVVIGYDTRESREYISNALISGALSVGLDVINAQIVPTPCLIYYSMVKKITGVMITASHNPYTDNGIKIFENGKKLSVSIEERIEKEIDHPICHSRKVGKIINTNDIIDNYISFINNYVVKTNMRVILDCANGATYKMAPYIFQKVTSNLEIIENKPNGKNINYNCGSTNIDNLVNAVLKTKADIGFAFDGDGDRVIAVSKSGNVFDGDKILYIIANYLKKRDKLNKSTIVLTEMSNLGILKKLEEEKINVILTDVGDKNVLEVLNKNTLSLGGESSGHIIMSDVLKTGDGILIALWLIKIIEEENKLLDELTTNVMMYKVKTTNMQVDDKSIINYYEVKKEIERIKNSNLNDTKIIVRPSGTENVIRITVMNKQEEEVERITRLLLEVINKYNVEVK